MVNVFCGADVDLDGAPFRTRLFQLSFLAHMSKLESVKFITLPKSMEDQITGFKIDSTIPIPVQMKEGSKHLDPEDVTIESIVAGMLVTIAYKEKDKNLDYYRSFVLAVQPNAIEELNTAAITKEKQKDYPFAEQLFLTVYHMLPQSASCINLATLYSSWAVHERDEGDEKAEEFYLSKCLNTLEEGLERFGENEDILAELGSFHTYLGNLDIAEGYLKRYMAVAEEGERKQKLKKMLKDVSFRIDSDNEIKQAYDFMMLDEEDKALETIESFIKKNPRLWHGHFIKGWALRRLKRYKEAEDELLRCISCGESNADIYNELSICALEKGDKELAKSYLDAAVDMDPENLTLVSNLAFLHLRDDEFDEAREWIEKCRKLAPEDSQVRQMMKEYTDKTGEPFGDVINEEYVHNPDKDGKPQPDKEDDEDDGYEEELAALEEDDDEDEGCGCGCSHDHHHHDHDHE